MEIERKVIVCILIVLVLFFVEGVWGAPVPVTGCRVISNPGQYSLMNDIVNSPATTCIEITASNVTFDGNGHIIDGTDTPATYGIWIRGSTPITNVTVSDVTVTQWYMGVYAFNARKTAIEDIRAEDNSVGISLSSTNNTRIERNEVQNNHIEEIYLWFSSENIIRGNHILSPDTSSIGMLVTQSHKNQIYNNYINNSQGVIAQFANTLNTTEKSGTNIIGGPALGGNFWATPDGNGYSETCIDSDANGFCDVPFVLNANNTDQLPLAASTLLPLPGYANPPTDPDHDGIYEDLNGNNRLDFADVVLYFNQMTWIGANEPIAAFDLNGNGRIDFADIVALFNEI